MRVHRGVAAFAFALVVLLWGKAPAGAAASDPAAFMNDLGNRVLHLISDKATPEAQRKQQFRELVEQSFDIPKIARFVLGRYWTTADEAQRKQFFDAFETYMIQVYWSRFQSYNGETFKVSATRDEGNGTILVTTAINRPETGQPPVKVDWHLVQSSDSFKIQDASLEGVSQALAYRDEFSSIIERNNGQVSALIQQLNARAKG